ncbi:hypothetical protein L917_11440, partial [Phytophthora nicotianae]
MISSLVKSGTSKIAGVVTSRAHLASADGVYALNKIKLGETALDALESPNLKKLAEVLTTRYADDAVAKALVTAMGRTNTAELATKLQKQQMNGWLDSQKSFDYVMGKLKIADDWNLTMSSRSLDALDEYIKLFNVRYPLAKTDITTELANCFGGEAKFARLVAIALQVPQSRRVYVKAEKFQNALFKQWKDRNLDPMGVLVQVVNVKETK